MTGFDVVEHGELLAVPRDHFVPDVIWVDDVGGDGFVAVSADTDRRRWDEEVHADRPVVIQVDDGRTAPGDVGLQPTSSCSQPSIVAAMLHALDVRSGQRVLEIGTGTGWNAALLAALVGPGGAVVSMEVDDAVAAGARRALRDAGSAARVVVADGLVGHPEESPYDRVVSTASLREIPRAWIDQARRGAVILTPWGSDYCNGALLRLIVQADGTAVGRCGMSIAFMRVRGQRRHFVEPTAEEYDRAERSTTTRPIAQIIDMVTPSRAAFAIGLRVPSCYLTLEDLAPGLRRLELHDVRSRSWARVELVRGATTFDVLHFGRRRLWAEIEDAYEWWGTVGRPAVDRFGLAVGRDGSHTASLDRPDGPHRWPLDPVYAVDGAW